MDGFNENSNEQQAQQPMGCLHRFSKTIKVVIIGGLILLLMIPMFMIENLISERGRTQEEAIDEVSRTDRHRPLSEYPISGGYREQRRKKGINQRPDTLPRRTFD